MVRNDYSDRGSVYLRVKVAALAVAYAGEVSAKIGMLLYDERVREESCTHRHRLGLVVHERACGMYRRANSSRGLHDEDKSNIIVLYLGLRGEESLSP